jgi:heptosyltransferase-3
MEAPAAKQKILVTKLRQLGDVLLTTPVFAALRSKFPDAEIIACVAQGTEAMLEGNPHINGVRVVPKSGGAFANLGFLRRIRRERYSLVLDLTTSDRSAIITAATGAKRRITFRTDKGFLGRRRCYTETVDAKTAEHTVLRNMRTLQPLGISPEEPRLIFPTSGAERAAVDRMGLQRGSFFQVHPFSRIPEKNWPVAFMAETVNAVAHTYGLKPVITGSAAAQEKAEIEELKKLLRCEHLDLSGKLTIKELGAVSERARFFLGVDTAPMHIAAAVGTPVVALFGPSSELLWAPWCDDKIVLSRELDCRLPCKVKHGCPTVHCLREFTPAMVWPQIQAFLQRL